MGYARRLLWFQRELATAPAASVASLALTLYTFGELFAGTRAWSQGLEMLDFVGKSFDAIYTVSDESICHTDFLTPVGFLRVFAHILAMHRGGVFLAAIPCNSWVSSPGILQAGISRSLEMILLPLSVRTMLWLPGLSTCSSSASKGACSGL